jgi:hypothetical protein
VVSPDTITDGSELGVVTVAGSPVRTLLMRPTTLILLIMSVTLIAAGLWFFEVYEETEESITYVAALATFVAGALIVTVGAAIGLTTIPVRQNVESLVSAFDRGNAYSVTAADDLSSMIASLNHSSEPRAGVKLRLVSYALIADDTLSFWSRSGTRLESFLAIPRSRIATARTDHVIAHGQRGDGLVLDVITNEGVIVELALTTSATRARGPMGMAVEAEESRKAIRMWALYGDEPAASV